MTPLYLRRAVRLANGCHVNVPNDVIVVDTETTGLESSAEVVEVGYVCGEAPMASSFVPPHTLHGADPKALEVNGYHERGLDDRSGWDVDGVHLAAFLDACRWTNATLAGFNIGFDEPRLVELGGLNQETKPWHYRALNIPDFVAAMLGLDRGGSLSGTSTALRAMGFSIWESDHSAGNDALAARDCLRAGYALQTARGIRRAA